MSGRPLERSSKPTLPVRVAALTTSADLRSKLFNTLYLSRFYTHNAWHSSSTSKPPQTIRASASPTLCPSCRQRHRPCQKKSVAGVGPILAQLKEATTEGLINAGEGDAMEEGEEPAYTHAEEVKRQIRREERKKKRTEVFKLAKAACE